jgi:hypothetical protein
MAGRDSSWLHHLPAPETPPPREGRVWRLVKDTRYAEARLRPGLLGIELRFVVGGDGRAEVLYWSCVYRPDESAELAQASKGVREDFERLGWSLPAECSDTRQ